MKQLLAIFLLTCISYQFVAKVGVIAWYQANKDYVAEELCENKEVTEMGCEGKCYLKKQLDKVDEPSSDAKDLPAKKVKTEIPECLSDTRIIIPSHHYIKALPVFNIYTNLYHYTHIRSVFHPPSFS